MLILLLGQLACRPDREKCKQGIIRAEHDFARMAADKGVAEAWKRQADGTWRFVWD